MAFTHVRVLKGLPVEKRKLKQMLQSGCWFINCPNTAWQIIVNLTAKMNKPPYSITVADLNDLDDLAMLFNEYRIFYKADSNLEESRKFIAERLTKKDSKIFMAKKDSKGVGFVQLYPTFSSVSMTKVWILNDLFVPPQERLQGLGRALIMASIEFSSGTGASRLSLSTAKDNPAQNLYQAIGFKESSFKFYNYSLL